MVAFTLVTNKNKKIFSNFKQIIFFMKNFQRALSVFVFALLLTGVFTLGGCEKSELVSTPSIFTQQLLSAKSVDEIAKVSTIKDLQIIKEVEFLKKMERITEEQYIEFHRTGVVFGTMDDGIIYYPLDGKAKNIPSYFPTREYIKQSVEREESNKQARHRRDFNMFIGGPITVRLHQNLPPEWKLAFQQAIVAWNSLGQNITMSSYNASNNDQVVNELDVRWGANSYIASTAYITAQYKFAEWILVSDTNAKVADTTPDGRKVIAAHELGHAIGLLHTDTTEGTDVSSLTGCSSSAIDSRSVMRQYPGKTSPWEGFTTCDFNVINYYW